MNLVNDVSNNQLECSTATTPIQNSTTRIENRAHVITEPEIAVDISTTESPMISKIQMSTPGIENRAKDTNAESNLFIERGPACHLTLFVYEIILMNSGFSLILWHQKLLFLKKRIK